MMPVYADARVAVFGSRPGGLSLPQLLLVLGLGLVSGVAAAQLGGALALFAVVALIGACAILWDWRIGIWLLILAFPQSGNVLMPRAMFGVTGLNPFNLLLVASLASLLLARVSARNGFDMVGNRVMLLAYVLPLVAWTAYGAPSVKHIPEYFHLLELVAFDNAASYFRDIAVRRVLFTAVVILMIATAVRHSTDPRRLLVPVWIALIGFALWLIVFIAKSGIPLSVWAQAESRSLYNDMGYHPNDMGLMLNMGYALLLFAQRGIRSPGRRSWALAALALVALAEMLTFSRAGYVGFAVITLAYFANRRQAVIIVGLVCLVWLLVKFVPDLPVFSRLSLGMASNNAAEITAGRTEDIWMPLIPTFLDNPLLGHGVYSILWSEPSRRGQILEVVHPHNAYLEALLDLGVVGLALELGFFAYLLRLFRHLARELDDPVLQGFCRGAALALTALLVQGMSGQSFVPSHLQGFLWIATGFAFGLQARLSRLPGAESHPTSVPLR